MSFAFTGCGETEQCIDCGGAAGGAVKCHINVFNTMDICAADQDVAANHCIAAGGSWVAYDICYESGETGGGQEPEDPWTPSRDITLDQKSGTYIIDRIAFEEFKLDSSALFSDSSKLSELESGYYRVMTRGKLTDALGWRTGDILLDVNGYELTGLSGFSQAYAELAEVTDFELTVLRGADEVILRYRVE